MPWKSIYRIHLLSIMLSLTIPFILFGQNKGYFQLKVQYNKYYKNERYDSALVIANEMSACFDGILKDTSRQYAVNLRYIGNSLIGLGQKDSAVLYYEKALKLLLLQHRDCDSDYVQTLNNLSDLYYEFRNYKAAVRYGNKLLEIRRWLLGQQHPSYVRLLNKLGVIYIRMSQYDTAQLYLIEALNTTNALYGKESIQYVNSLNNLGVLYSDIGKNKEAKECYVEVLEIRKRLLGEKSSDYVEALSNLGALCWEEGNYKEALVYLSKALEMQGVIHGKNSVEYANSLASLGVLYEDMSQFLLAESHLNNARILFEDLKNTDNEDFADLLNNLGSLYWKMGDYKDAEKYFLQGMERRKELLGETHLDYGSSLNNLGVLYTDMGQYNLAEKYLFDGLHVRVKAVGEIHTLCAGSYTNIGTLYQEMGNFKLAEKYSLQALEIKRITLGEEHPDFIGSLNNLGVLYKEMEQYDVAKSYYSRALEIQKRVYGMDNPKYAASLNNIANLFKAVGNFQKAEEYYKKSLEIKKSALGVEHPDYISGFENLGMLYNEMGLLSSAEGYYQKVIASRELTLGKQHPDYASSLDNMGNLKLSMGDWKAAEGYYQESKSIRRSALGVEHPDFANSLNNLGNLYSEIGNYKAAEQSFQEALQIRKQTIGEKHSEYAATLDNLGTVYSDMGDNIKAEKYYKEAMAIRQSILGDQHSDVALSLNNLGSLYCDLAKYGSAIEYFKNALSIQKSTVGVHHIDYGRTLGNIAVAYDDYNMPDSAVATYKQVLAVYEELLGKQHPNYIEVENNYATTLVFSGKIIEGYDILSKNINTIRDRMVENFDWLTENQKDAFWAKEAIFLSKLLFICSYASEKYPLFNSLAYNTILMNKSRLLESKLNRASYPKAAETIRNNLALKKIKLYELIKENSTQKRLMEKLTEEIDSLEKRIIVSWPLYAQQKQNLSITWKQVQKSLTEKEASIEFYRYKDYTDSLYYYAALIVRTGDPTPILVRLCKEAVLMNAQIKNNYYDYYNLIWRPMEKYLKGIGTIYYAPDGELNNIALAALYAEPSNTEERVDENSADRGLLPEKKQAILTREPTYLMDTFKLHQLISTRYLVTGLKERSKAPISRNILLIGGVNYNYLPGINTDATSTASGKKVMRGAPWDPTELPYLPGTLTEVSNIKNILSSKNWQTTMLTWNDAKMEKVVSYQNKTAPGILHIASHGFSFPEFLFQDTTGAIMNSVYSYRYNQEPMARSGIVLSGGNWAWTGSDTLKKLGRPQNGLLTALDVSQLQLQNTELVVLSACETGLGKIEGAEGTFGLKRGFKLAGVDQIILSLWSVPDKETMELMIAFYSEMSNTLDPVASFQTAQRTLRKKYPQEPWKWAAFVLIR